MGKKHRQSKPSEQTSAKPDAGTLIGKIVHCRWGATMVLNDFCVVLDETPKTALLARLNTPDNRLVNCGYERPLLQDGGQVARALLNVTRVNSKAIQPKTTLVAELRIDPGVFHLGDISDASWLKHGREHNNESETVTVLVFRASKVTAKDGSLHLRHRNKEYQVWDGQDQYFDYTD